MFLCVFEIGSCIYALMFESRGVSYSYGFLVQVSEDCYLWVFEQYC